MAKKVAKDNECPLYNDERINPPRRHSNLKCVCVKQSCKIYEGKYGWNWMEK